MTPDKTIPIEAVSNLLPFSGPYIRKRLSSQAVMPAGYVRGQLVSLAAVQLLGGQEFSEAEVTDALARHAQRNVLRTLAYHEKRRAKTETATPSTLIEGPDVSEGQTGLQEQEGQDNGKTNRGTIPNS
jgi:hypothetical protein